MRLAPGLRSTLALTVLGTAALAPATSWAHFTLVSPPAATEQDVLGNPQKAPPCGDDGTAVATEIITGYGPGDTVTITIEETIFHPGHYRIALAANDPSELPEPAPVTPGDTPCGSAPIQDPPVFPVLADGVFEHTEPFADPQQSIDITLPDDVTCTSCTLQVIQFMSDHALNDPGGCYYHHCATLEIDGAAATSSGGDTDAGSTSFGDTANGTDPGGSMGDEAETSAPSDDTGSAATTSTGGGTGSSGSAGGDDDDEGGCGCSSANGRGAPAAALLGLLGLLGLRSRRSRR